MEQRMSAITLGVADLARARRFYEDGLGWRPAFAADEIVFYQTSSVVLALFGRADLAADAGVADDGGAPRGFTLAQNVADAAAVDGLLAEAAAAGAVILKPGAAQPWGGYAGKFADPDGHVWDVAWNPAWQLGDDGRVRIA
jgi:catechol 2,3-dioxygenase-like lactoylglutathione lyase family enzyme